MTRFPPVALVLAVATPARAACPPTTVRGVLRSSVAAVWGTIVDGVPDDPEPEAIATFFVDVRGYFKGTGPARITVAYRSEVVILGVDLREESRRFVERTAGKDVVAMGEFDGARLVTAPCGGIGTGPSSQRTVERLRALRGEPQPPLARAVPEGVSDGIPWWIWLVGAAAVLSLGLSIARRLARIGAPPQT